MAGTAVLRNRGVELISMKKATATSQGRSRVVASAGAKK